MEIEGFDKKKLDFFFEVWNYKTKEEQRNIIENWDKIPFKWPAILGPAKLGNLKIYDENTPHTFDLPQLYLQENNTFIPIVVEKIFSVILHNDWLNFFTYETDDKFPMTNWAHRKIRFVPPEIYKQAYGTPKKSLTFYEETIRGNSEFAGSSIYLPYDWKTPEAPSRPTIQAIMLTSFIHDTQVKIDHHKRLAIECILDTPNQYYNYMVNSVSREDESIKNFLYDRDFKMTAIVNKKDEYPVSKLISLLNERMAIYNRTYKSSNYGAPEWALIVPEKLIIELLQKENYHLNFKKGHRNEEESLYNKEDKVLRPWYKIKNVYVFPVKPFRFVDFPEGKQILDSFKQEVLFNYFPNPLHLLENNDIIFENNYLNIYIKDYKENSKHVIKYKNVLLHTLDIPFYTNKIYNDGKTIEQIYQLYYNILDEEELGKRLIIGILGNILKRYNFKNFNEFVNGFKHTVMLDDELTFRYDVPTAEVGNNMTRTRNPFVRAMFETLELIFSILDKIRPGIYNNKSETCVNIFASIFGVETFKKILKRMQKYTNALWIEDNNTLKLRKSGAGLFYDFFTTSIYTAEVGVVEGNINNLNQNFDRSIQWFWGEIKSQRFTRDIIKSCLQNNLPLPFELGFFREALFKTSSCIYIRQNSIELYGHTEKTRIVKREVKGEHFIDTTRSFAVKVNNPRDYYTCQDIKYENVRYNCCPNHYMEPIDNVTNRNKCTTGGIIPFILNKDEMRNMKSGLIPKSGMYNDKWASVVTDNTVMNQFFEAPPYIKKFAQKYKRGLGSRMHFYFYNSNIENGIIKPTEFAFQGWQKNYDFNKNKWEEEIEQCGYLKDVLVK